MGKKNNENKQEIRSANGGGEIVILNRLVRIWFIGKVDLSKEARDFQAYV